MFLSDYSQTQSPNGRNLCIRFVETKIQFGFHFTVNFSWGGQQNILKPTSKYLYLICHKYFLKPKSNTKPKNHSHFGFHFVSKSSSRVGNRIFSNPEKKPIYKCSTCKYEISKSISFKYFIKPR